LNLADLSGVIAGHVGQAASPEKTILIDAFGGAGGSAIAFAKSGRWEEIFVIEQDKDTLECAKHNADLYGVRKDIHFSQGDCFEAMKTRFKYLGHKVVIFASPPWGGQFPCSTKGSNDAGG
jgi:trimethylguanosine synthase